MWNKLLTASVFAFALLFVGTGFADQALSQKVQDKNGKYAVDFPADWKVSDGKDLGVDVVIQSPKPTKDNFTDNANLLTETLPMAMSPKDYFDRGLVDLKKFDGFKLVGTKELDINGLKAIEAEYSYLYNGFRVNVLQYAVIKDKLAVILTFGADPEDYSNMKPTFQEIAKTLVVK